MIRRLRLHATGASPKRGADAARARPAVSDSWDLLLRVGAVVHLGVGGVGGGRGGVAGLLRLFLHLGAGLVADRGGVVGGLGGGGAGGGGGSIGGVGDRIAGIGGGGTGIGRGGLGGGFGSVSLRLGGVGLGLVVRSAVAGGECGGHGEGEQDAGAVVHVRVPV